MSEVKEIEYPIAEIFVAPQGEGRHVGRLMTFVRLAGCTVGTRYARNHYPDLTSTPEEPLFPIYTNECHIYDGRTMPCDTDYRKKESLTAQQIKKRIMDLGNVQTVCISGGEPLMHNLVGLLFWLGGHCGHKINMETSGTIPVTDNVIETLALVDHLAVSPKEGFIPEYAAHADELKILVDENFVWENMPSYLRQASDRIYLQPVNFEKTLNMDNVRRCLDIQQEHPEVLLSTQNHKIWEVR